MSRMQIQYPIFIMSLVSSELYGARELELSWIHHRSFRQYSIGRFTCLETLILVGTRARRRRQVWRRAALSTRLTKVIVLLSRNNVAQTIMVHVTKTTTSGPSTR